MSAAKADVLDHIGRLNDRKRRHVVSIPSGVQQLFSSAGLVAMFWIIVSIGTQWGLFLPLAFLIGPVLGYGLLGVWIWQGVTRIFQSALFLSMWRGRKWQHIEV